MNRSNVEQDKTVFPTVYLKRYEEEHSDIMADAYTVMLRCLMLVLAVFVSVLVCATPEAESTQGFGCGWFTYVKRDSWAIMSLNKVRNQAQLLYDTNDDGRVNLVHEYAIDAWGSAGDTNSAPILHDTPTQIREDLDHDGFIDLHLVDTSGTGHCTEWRSMPLPERKRSKRIEPTHRKKGTA